MLLHNHLKILTNIEPQKHKLKFSHYKQSFSQLNKKPLEASMPQVVVWLRINN